MPQTPNIRQAILAILGSHVLFQMILWCSPLSGGLPSCHAEAEAAPGARSSPGVFQRCCGVCIYAMELTAATTASQAALSMSLSAKSSIVKDSTEAGS